MLACGAIAAGWFMAVPAGGLDTAQAQSVPVDPAGGFSALAVFDQALADFDQAQQIQATQPGRARQLFRAAAQGFETLTAAGDHRRFADAQVLWSGQVGSSVVNGRLEFNLANCYLQAGDVGRAILHYRRALRLIPRDELLKENHELARSRCLTSIRPTRRSTTLKSVLAWYYQTSVPERAKAAIVLYVVLWILLALGNFVRSRALFASVAGCVLLTAILGISLAADRWSDRNAPGGVVTAMDVTVRKGPGTGYHRQFEQPLQPGVEFTLRQRRGDWWDIRLPDGQSGWIEAVSADLIPTGG